MPKNKLTIGQMLVKSLTPEKPRLPHLSILRNPLIAEPLYLTHDIEKVGTGTLDMIARCREASLSEPDFHQDGGQWVFTLWRDWLTDSALSELGISERQRMAIAFAKDHHAITNSRYQIPLFPDFSGFFRKR